jgi:hypothetical protein
MLIRNVRIRSQHNYKSFQSCIGPVTRYMRKHNIVLYIL